MVIDSPSANSRLPSGAIIGALDPPDGTTYPWQPSDNQDYNLYKSFSASETLAYLLDKANITSITNYNWNRNQWSFDSSYVDAPNYIPALEDTTFHAFSTELRALTTFDGPVNFLAGVYYQSTKRIYDQAVALGNVQDSTQSPDNFILASTKNSETTGSTISGYAQAIWKVIPSVEITGGVRYTHETKDSYFVQPYVNAALVSVFIPNKRIGANQVFDNYSPDFTVTYKPSHDVTLYGAFKKGYKSGGFSNGGILGPKTTLADFAFNPETVKGYEIGIKTTLLDNQLRLNVGANDYKFSNLQLDYFDAVNIALVATNAGSARTQGIEWESEFAPRDIIGLNLRATANYNKARYENFLAPCYGGESIAAGCDLAYNAAGGVYTKQNLSGTPTSVAPPWTGSVGANYDLPVSPSLYFGIATDARFSGPYIVSPFGTPSARNPSYANIDGAIHLRTGDSRYEAAIIGKNLTNRFYVLGGIDSTNTGAGTGTGTAKAVPADQIGFAGFPRTVALQFSAKF